MESVDTQTDEQLLAAWQNDACRGSVNLLLDRHVPQVRGMVARIGVSPNDVDDLTQEIIVRAFRGLDSFKSDSKFSTWLYVIALNRVRNHFAEKKRNVGRNETLPDVADNRKDSPEQLARLSETSLAVQSAINSLSEPLRLAIVLTSLEGMNTEQAATICECSTNTLYARIHKARKLLKEQLVGLLE